MDNQETSFKKILTAVMLCLVISVLSIVAVTISFFFKPQSAYDLAVKNGFVGTEQQWIASLKGDTGSQGGQGEKGDQGSIGKSAYELAVENGFAGTKQQWLESLEGEDGDSAYDLAVEDGFNGTKSEWIASLKGEKGNKGDKGDTGDDGENAIAIEQITIDRLNAKLETISSTLSSKPTLLDRFNSANITNNQLKKLSSTYLYSYNDNEFIAVDGAGSVAYTTSDLSNYEIGKDVSEDVNLFTFVLSNNLSTEYSNYLVGGTVTTLNISTGLDMGNVTGITTINYTNDTGAAKDVAIRTYGGSLIINDTNNASHQYHYGFASSVTVTTGTSCYECHAIIKSMKIIEGKAIADKGAYVGIVEASEGVTLQEENGGIFVIPSNADITKIDSIVASSIGYTISDGNVIPSSDKAEKATEASETAKNKLNEEVGKNESYVARIDVKGYANFQDALNAAEDDETVYLLKSVTINDSDLQIYDKNITIDGLNNSISILCSSEYAEEQEYYTYGLHIVGNTKNIVVDIKNLTINGIGSVRYALIYDGSDDGKYCASGNVYDCIVSCSYVGLGVSGNDYGNSDVELYNCNISHVAPDATENGWLNCAVAPQFDGRVTIHSGNYSSTDYCCYIYSTGGILNIEGGSFNADIVLKAQYTSSYSEVHQKAEIIVKGGEFTGNIDACNGTTETITLNNNAIVTGSIGNGVVDNRTEE